MTLAGWEAAGVGLQPGQVILKVNGNNVNHSDYQEVLEHFTAQHTHQEPPKAVRGHNLYFNSKNITLLTTIRGNISRSVSSFAFAAAGGLVVYVNYQLSYGCCRTHLVKIFNLSER